MRNAMKQVAKLGVKAASIMKNEAQKELRVLSKKGLIHRKQLESLTKRVVAEGKAEAARFAGFVKKEVAKEMRKAKPILSELKASGKRAVARSKPKLKKVARKAVSAARKGIKRARR